MQPCHADALTSDRGAGASGRVVLVTGSGGFVGRPVVGLLKAGGFQVVELPHRWRSADELRGSTQGVTDCIHLGWYAVPGNYLVSVEENLRSFHASLDLLGALGAGGCRSVVVAGTSAEYAPSGRALREDSPIGPWSVYGAMKAGARLVAMSSAVPPTLGVAWGRLFNVVGPGEHPDRVVPSAARALLAGEPMALSLGEQIRDYIDVADAAGALVHLCDRRETGDFNISTGVGTSIRDFLTGLGDRLGRTDLLRFGDRLPAGNDVEVSVGANERLVGSGWVRQHSLDATLDRIATYWSGERPSAGLA